MENWNKWHDKYEESKDKKHIDAIFDLAYDYCNENGIKTSNDDRAEEFVSAITKYIEESKKTK